MGGGQGCGGGTRRGWKRDEGGEDKKNKRLFFHSPPPCPILPHLSAGAAPKMTCIQSMH
jgi:hypothetical protein